MNRPLLIELSRELPDEIDLNDLVDASGVRYIGKAKRQSSGMYHCLADVGGALCIAEVIAKRYLDDAATEWKKSG